MARWSRRRRKRRAGSWDRPFSGRPRGPRRSPERGTRSPVGQKRSTRVSNPAMIAIVSVSMLTVGALSIWLLPDSYRDGVGSDFYHAIVVIGTVGLVVAFFWWAPVGILAMIAIVSVSMLTVGALSIWLLPDSYRDGVGSDFYHAIVVIGVVGLVVAWILWWIVGVLGSNNSGGGGHGYYDG